MLLFRKLCVTITSFAAMTAAQTAFAEAFFPSGPTEPAPIFRVQEVLDAEILQGPDYTIAQDVPVRDFKYLFTVRTPYGEFKALGKNMLELRLRELLAIDRARKMMRDPQMFQGVIETVQQTPQGVWTAITDPGGTLLRAPKGLQRMASNYLNPQNFRAGAEDRRRFAAQIGCDPETSNPVLIAMLDNLAFRKSVGKTGSNLGLHVVLPGLGLLSTTQDFREELVRRTPSEVNAEIEKELLEMGVWEPVARQFCRERSYTTIQRMVFMRNLRALQDIENVEYLVYRATAAYNEVEGLGVIREMQMLKKIHEQQGILRIDLQGLPVAMLRDRSLVIVNAEDYIHDSNDLRDGIDAFRRARPNDPAVLVAAGRVSARAKETLAGFSLGVTQSGQPAIVDRNSDTPNRR